MCLDVIFNAIMCLCKTDLLVFKDDIRNPYLIWNYKNLIYSVIIVGIPLKERISPTLRIKREGDICFSGVKKHLERVVLGNLT